MKKQINSNGATEKALKYEVLDTISIDLWGAINAVIITPFAVLGVLGSILEKSEDGLKFLSPFQTSGKVLYAAIAYQLLKDPLPSLLWGWNYLPVKSYFNDVKNKIAPLQVKAEGILLESNDISIMSYEKTNEINTLYGTYLESSSTNSTKGFYIMIQGADDNRVLEIGNYLTSILIKKGYDLIKISAEQDHIYSMAKIHELVQKYEPTSKLEGLIIHAHGSYIEHNTSVIESYFDTSFLRDDTSYAHKFLFQSKEGEITIENGTLKGNIERLAFNTETVLIDFYKYFKPYLSNDFEFLLSSCKSAALRLERILEIIPELKCYYTGTSKIGEDVKMHPRRLEIDFIKHFLLDEERECPVVDYYQQFYQQFDQQFNELSSSHTDKYSQTYFHASNEISVVE